VSRQRWVERSTSRARPHSPSPCLHRSCDGLPWDTTSNFTTTCCTGITITVMRRDARNLSHSVFPGNAPHLKRSPVPSSPPERSTSVTSVLHDTCVQHGVSSDGSPPCSPPQRRKRAACWQHCTDCWAYSQIVTHSAPSHTIVRTTILSSRENASVARVAITRSTGCDRIASS